MMFGADFERKGVDIACRAISNMRQKGVLIQLFVVCSIAKEECEKKVKDCCKSDTIPEWIRIVSAREDIATYYHMADVFISPSREEGFTYAIPEAIYCGCKVVASIIGGQYYHKDIPGIMWIKSEDILALENAIKESIENSWNSNEAVEYVVNKYSVQHWSNQIASIYIDD